MSTQTEICNMALSHLGSGKEIANVETERSQEAEACRRFYDTSLQATLKDFPWPFAKRFKALALVQTCPTNEWKYSYRYPSDCLNFLRIISGIRRENQQSRVKYKIMSDAEGELIFTDRPCAVGEYITPIIDPNRYSPDFILALSLRIATYIAPRVTGGDPFKLGDKAMSLYLGHISRAQASATDEEEPDLQAESEFIRGRND